MTDTLKPAVLLAAGLGLNAAPALALQTTATQVEKDANGTMTYRSSIKLDQGETLNPHDGRSPADFVTVYSFFGFVKGSVKVPVGWEFSSEELGQTPALNGYPIVLPADVANTPNFTWTVTKPAAAGAQVDGSTAVTRMARTPHGEYPVQITHQAPATRVPTGTPAVPAAPIKQALIGLLPTPSFLADVK